MKNRKTEAQKRKQRTKVMGEKMEKESKGSEGKFGACTCSCEERQIGRQTDRQHAARKTEIPTFISFTNPYHPDVIIFNFFNPFPKDHKFVLICKFI